VRTLQIASEYNYKVLFALLVSTYKFLNPSDVSVEDPNSISQSIEISSLYDLKVTNEEMESTMVKEPWSRKSWKKKVETL
jgi:hypothetical protein